MQMMGGARMKQIYDICVKYGQYTVKRIRLANRDGCLDVIIVEDDPYYFLQLGTYTPKEARPSGTTLSGGSSADDSKRFVSTLTPSFVKYGPFIY